ncbi:uncharacterized protein LY79DRAFT_258593 [Colletotrichum navitas]|uniref:Uncharacterized protein n=1 Tax=Colletotrichum navitas TaxID=681940 RepID=A0AAD8PWE2_9PEZI|nr:uncharacterized protein LY79DRAFT_258593 [Colletotrichum navitas]KAK1585911.1 hypothetical protein LY79DRAFT_258593 [Colletotrichum navitas]
MECRLSGYALLRIYIYIYIYIYIFIKKEEKEKKSSSRKRRSQGSQYNTALCPYNLPFSKSPNNWWKWDYGFDGLLMNGWNYRYMCKLAPRRLSVPVLGDSTDSRRAICWRGMKSRGKQRTYWNPSPSMNKVVVCLSLSSNFVRYSGLANYDFITWAANIPLSVFPACKSS